MPQCWVIITLNSKTCLPLSFQAKQSPCFWVLLYSEADSWWRYCLMIKKKITLSFHKPTSLKCFDRLHVRVAHMYKIQTFYFTHTHTHSTKMINVFSSWWQDVHSVAVRPPKQTQTKTTHGSDVPALRSALLPPFPPHVSCLLAARPLAPSGAPRRSFGLKWPQLLLIHNGCKSASKGFWHMIQHLWCHQQLTCHKTFVKRGEVRDEWGEGLIFNRPLAWNAECFCIKLLRLQTEWLLLENDSIIYHNTIS